MNSTHNSSEWNDTFCYSFNYYRRRKGFDTTEINSYFLLAVLYIGLITNSLTAVVWYQQLKIKSGVFFICCLSVADAVFCLMWSLKLVVSLRHPLGHCGECTFYEAIKIPGAISRTLTVAMVAHRWISVTKPVWLSYICRTSRQCLMLLCLLIPFVAVLMFDIYVIATVSCTTSYRTISNKKADFEHLLFVLQFSFTSVTSVCLFIFSALLLSSLCTFFKTKSGSLSRVWHQDAEVRLTIAIICVSVFSMLEFFVSLIFVIDKIVQLEIDKFIAVNVFYWVSVLNSTINFVFYSCIGQEFRENLKQLFQNVLFLPMNRCYRGTKERVTQREITKDTDVSVDDEHV